MSKPFLAILALSAAAQAAPGSLAAQPAPAGQGELVDRVVAVVGDSVVLLSDVQQDLMQLQAAGQLPTADSAAIERARRQILEEHVTELLLLQAALRDSIEVTTTEVDAAINRQIDETRNSLGGEQAFQEALRRELGMTVVEYREMLARDFRRAELSRRYLQSVVRDRKPPPVSEDEVRRFFEENQAQFGDRPATVTFRQVVIPPQPSDSARAAARARAEEVLRRARAGEDFAELARRHSEDLGTREQGGDLGWAREGKYVQAFDRVLFSMRPGTISDIVETGYGFHIIKLERVRGAERQARHILIQHDLASADTALTRARAEEALARLRAGESMDAVVRALGNPDELVAYDNVLVDRLPPQYAAALENAQPNELIGPIAIPNDQGAVAYAVVRFLSRTPAGQYTLADVRATIRQQLERQKLLEELVEELRRETFVDIRL